LEIGSRVVPLVRVIVLFFYPISFPLAWSLDKALGAELATTYSNAEMLKLLQIHVAEDAMDKDTATAMTGALKYRDMEVREVMTPLPNTFMLSVQEKLNFETIARIFKTGYSRIPVYEINKVCVWDRLVLHASYKKSFHLFCSLHGTLCYPFTESHCWAPLCQGSHFH
jgi:metal transporter CNNM